MFNEQEQFPSAFTAAEKEQFARHALRYVPNDEIDEDLIEQLRKWVPE